MILGTTFPYRSYLRNDMGMPRVFTSQSNPQARLCISVTKLEICENSRIWIFPRRSPSKRSGQTRSYLSNYATWSMSRECMDRSMLPRWEYEGLWGADDTAHFGASPEPDKKSQIGFHCTKISPGRSYSLLRDLKVQMLVPHVEHTPFNANFDISTTCFSLVLIRAWSLRFATDLRRR